MRTERLGSLTARIVGGQDRNGGGDGPVVVLMHGFGAPGHDLVDLWRVLPLSRHVRFVFPEAPLTLGPGYGDGRAWWMLDLEALEQRARGERVDHSTEVPEGLASARAQIEELLTNVQTRLGVSDEQLVIGGFSQGAMLACDVALQRAKAPAGLVMLSGTLIARPVWEPRMAARASMPIFQSHGEQDPLLAFEDAERLRDLWRAAGAKVSFVPFRGGHEIPYAVLERLVGFLSDVLSG